jgi:hypothetical protein
MITLQQYDILARFNTKQLYEYFSLIQLHSDLNIQDDKRISIIS